jgi:GWxTD domain-containing protein
VKRATYLGILFATFWLMNQALTGQTAEAGSEYAKWLDEDVHWIITARERSEFLTLTSDHARDEFIGAFWEKRNPTPGAAQNPFKAEHYRRLAFANEHFAANIAGWKSDRGHIYILYGPPDEITRGSGGPGGYPSQVWHYRHLMEGKSVFEFVDDCRCGIYKLKQ